MINKTVSLNKNRKGYTRGQRRMVFYTLMFALPILQFFLFYLYVNFNSIVMAFQDKVEIEPIGYATSFTWNHLKNAFQFFAEEECWKMLGNSFGLLFGQLFIVTPLALLFSYYIAKGKPGSSLFRIMLYLPQVLSVVVLGVLYQEIMNKVYPFIMETAFGKKDVASLMTQSSTYNAQFWGAYIFTLWFSFGANVLIYTGAMSGIDQSIVESAHLDGVTSIQEFYYIYVPMIFSTLTTFIVTGFAGIFNNQMSLHTFFGNDKSKVKVFGYYFYGTAAMNIENAGPAQILHELAALGLIATLIIIPITLIVRKSLNKYGPRVD